MLLSSILSRLALAAILFSSPSLAANEGEESRWLVQTSTWATLSWMEDGDVSSMVVSHAESNGRIFINLPIGEAFPGALTFSEAQIDPLQFEGAQCGPDGSLDPEDPRCAKLTISGNFAPVTEDVDKQIGQQALFATHPAMKDWPEDHGFVILELEVKDIWMIANFGGGGAISTDLYFGAQPMHHPVMGFGDRRTSATVKRRLERPTFTSPAAHARWLVSNSLWTTVSTDGSKRMGVENQAWGNIRSMHDGECLSSSVGLPVFYLPTPDPTNVDVLASNGVSLSFTEASLPDLVGADGSICNGEDPEDPTCAKLSLHGSARPLTDDELGYAMKAFGSTHPRGSWLSSGGGHTGGQYYTIDLHSLQFLENYGGFADLSVEDYLTWYPKASDNLGADQMSCDARSSFPLEAESSNSGSGGWGSGSGGGQGGHGGMGGEQHGGMGGEQHGGMGGEQHGGMGGEQHGGMGGEQHGGMGGEQHGGMGGEQHGGMGGEQNGGYGGGEGGHGGYGGGEGGREGGNGGYGGGEGGRGGGNGGYGGGNGGGGGGNGGYGGGNGGYGGGNGGGRGGGEGGGGGGNGGYGGRGGGNGGYGGGEGGRGGGERGGYGGGEGGREGGMGGHVMARAQAAPAVVEEDSGFTFSSFAIGTAFGFMVWGPTMVMFVYFKYYSGRTPSTPKNYNAVIPSQAEVV